MASYLHYLRIGWTLLCATIAVVLVIMWVRSYLHLDSIQPWGHEVLITGGSVLIDETWVASSEPPSISTSSEADGPDGFHVTTMTTQILEPAGTGIRIPLWLPTILLVFGSAVPWLPLKRFSLRTLLIATTLVALIMGLVVYFAN